MILTHLLNLLIHTLLLEPLHNTKQIYTPLIDQNLPNSTSLNDNLYNTFDYRSDFEMLQSPIYHSTSSSTPSFPQLHPRVADSPNTYFDSSFNSQTLPTHIRASHSPYNLRLLPPKNYQNLKPNIYFPS